MIRVDPQIRAAIDAIVRDLRKLQRDTNRLLAVLKAQRAERPDYFSPLRMGEILNPLAAAKRIYRIGCSKRRSL